jgi:hypothetical protein
MPRIPIGPPLTQKLYRLENIAPKHFIQTDGKVAHIFHKKQTFSREITAQKVSCLLVAAASYGEKPDVVSLTKPHRITEGQTTIGSAIRYVNHHVLRMAFFHHRGCRQYRLA